MTSFNLPLFLSNTHSFQTSGVRNIATPIGNHLFKTTRKLDDPTMLPTVNAIMSDNSLISHTLPFHKVCHEVTVDVLHKRGKKPQSIDVYVFKMEGETHLRCYLKNSLVEPYDPQPLRDEVAALCGGNEADRVFLESLRQQTRPLNARQRQRLENVKKRIGKAAK